MKKLLVGIVGSLLLSTIGAGVLFAQNDTVRSVAGDKWLISAKAGGVNLVQGTVNIARKAGRSGLLLKGDSIEVGDIVTTGADGRAEILLNPGSYMRLAENSTFEFKTTDLEDLQVGVTRGSAILEVFAANDFRVSVHAPKDKYDLIETGVYRVDVAADGSARIEVWKGKAEVGDSVLKGGRAAVSTDGQLAVAKFDRDERDPFEEWSRARAKELAKGTNDLKDKTLRTSLMSSFLRGRWNMYDSFGLWVYSAQYGRYCFLPFGYGWSSPYGFGFGADIWWYRLPQAVYMPPISRPGTGNPNPPAGTPPRQPGVPGDRRPRQPGAKAPPFAAMQGGSSTGPRYGRGIDRSGGDGGFTGSPRSGGTSRRPVYSPGPSQSAPATPAPIRQIGGSRTPQLN